MICRSAAIVLSALVLGGAACAEGDFADTGSVMTSAASVPTTTSVPSAADYCDATEVTPSAVIDDPALDEISGVALSRRHAGIIWAIEDAGSSPAIHPIGADGTVLDPVAVDAEATDWEDLALAPVVPGGPDVVWIGDIGDNGNARPEVRVVRVEEPDPFGSDTVATPVDTTRLTYPDGTFDAEALLADPLTGDLVILTKRYDRAELGIYTLGAASLGSPEPVVMTAAGTLDLGRFVPGASADERTSKPTAAAVSPDGTTIAVRTYGGLFVWDRPPGRSIPDTLAGDFCEAPTAPEPQGEAVALDAEGYVTVGEGARRPIHRFTSS